MSATETNVAEPQLIAERSGSLGRLRLNRPKALNSLTLAMVRSMQQALDAFEQDPKISAVLVTGGERGLCAGGDVRAIYESGHAGTNLAATFWREEYLLDARISRYPKPYVVVMDGITMGGGVGISAHGRHRVVTERTRLAMPETGIGYFPDVGATWLLSRGQGELGTYLGLTGEHIGAADVIEAGLADVFVPTGDIAALAEALSAVPVNGAAAQVAEVLERFSRPAHLPELAQDRSAIDRLFAFDKVETILAALEMEATEFAWRTREILLSKSPTSLKLTLRLLRLGRTAASLEECLERELVGSVRMLATHDFYEGIRAAVIDKDRKPKWSPDNLAAVTDTAIEAFWVRPASLPPLFAASTIKED